MATITDVTLREYGQNVPAAGLDVFTPQIRIEIASRLIKAGISRLEVLSCAHPKVAPAMNKAALKEIAQGLGKVPGVDLITLVPNRGGYKTFLDLELGPEGFDHILGVFFSAVEAHNLANLGRTLEKTIEEYAEILQDARERRIRTAGYVSAAFGYLDPDQGALIRPEPAQVNAYIDRLLHWGVETVTLSDLQGVADQGQTAAFLEALLSGRKGKDTERLGYHPHHVQGKEAVSNSRAAYDLGITRFDASLGGTGGCVTGAPGNQPTEGLIALFKELGVETGVDEGELHALVDLVQRELYSRIPLTRNPS